MAHKILNTWHSSKNDLQYYNIKDEDLICRQGNIKTFKMPYNSCLYTYKDIAIMHTIGLDLNTIKILESEVCSDDNEVLIITIKKSMIEKAKKIEAL